MFITIVVTIRSVIKQFPEEFRSAMFNRLLSLIDELESVLLGPKIYMKDVMSRKVQFTVY